jgi:hypothetical protein
MASIAKNTSRSTSWRNATMDRESRTVEGNSSGRDRSSLEPLYLPTKAQVSHLLSNTKLIRSGEPCSIEP